VAMAEMKVTTVAVTTVAVTTGATATTAGVPMDVASATSTATGW